MGQPLRYLLRADSIADESLRSALTPILWVVCPTLVFIAWFVSGIDHPGSPAAMRVLLGTTFVLALLTTRWQLRPPRRVHAAVALSIGLLQLCLVGTLRAIPDPALATQQVILTIATAFYLVDWRWMLSMQAFGVGCWLYATGFGGSGVQWELARFGVFAGWGAAGAFYAGRISSLARIRKLAEEGREREEAQREVACALRESEARLRDAQQIARVGSFEWKLDTNELHWSDEHYRIFGWEPGAVEVDLTNFVEALHPEDRDRFGEVIEASLRDGDPVELEFRIRRADGEERVLLGASKTYHDENGKPTRHVGSAIDITERHRAEAALRASEARLTALLTAMDAGRAVVVSPDGIVLSILGESGHTGEYGVTGEDVPGMSIYDFLPGEAGDQLMAAVRDVYRTGERGEIEASVELPVGLCQFDVSLRALRAANGGIESVLAIVRDMTQRRADAEALRQAQKLESLGVLAGGVAHDFNNLLVGILGNAELLLERLGPDSPLSPGLEDIHRSSLRASDLTHELLAYAGTARLVREPVDLSEIVGDTVQLVRGTLPGNVAVSFTPAPEPAGAMVDATQIRQVVMNFLTNAAEATRPGDGPIEVRVNTVAIDRRGLERCTIRSSVEPGEFCRVAVTDHGIGMDAKTLDRIFDPFYTTKFQGRGLGLASAIGIVRAHGGVLRVESEPDEGTTFTVLLPRTSGPVAPDEEDESVGRRGSETVLVVDDEDVVRTAARRILEGEGYRVIDAASGSQAVELLREGIERIDLALLDVTMPEMDGEQTFVALRALAPSLPVVFMSGHSGEDIARRVVGKDRATQLSKPFRIADLSRVVAEMLD